MKPLWWYNNGNELPRHWLTGLRARRLDMGPLLPCYKGEVKYVIYLTGELILNVMDHIARQIMALTRCCINCFSVSGIFIPYDATFKIMIFGPLVEHMTDRSFGVFLLVPFDIYFLTQTTHSPPSPGDIDGSNAIPSSTLCSCGSASSIGHRVGLHGRCSTTMVAPSVVNIRRKYNFGG